MRYYTDDGTPYYENLETQETSWDAPPSFIEATDDGMYEEEVEVGDLISLLFSSLLFSSLLFSSLFLLAALQKRILTIYNTIARVPCLHIPYFCINRRFYTVV